MTNWDKTEQAKTYRQNFKKLNYDTLSINIVKGLKTLLAEELKLEEKSIATFVTDNIIDYLKSRGYTNKQIAEYLQQAKKEAEI